MTPIDVVKTRIQIDPTFKKFGIVSGTRHLVATEGASALLTGFGPSKLYRVIRSIRTQTSSTAAVGYLVQGGAKFAGYEFWKKKAVEFAGNQETAVKYRTAIYLGSASIAEYARCSQLDDTTLNSHSDSLLTSFLRPSKLRVSV